MEPPPFDNGPAERAGVASPADADLPGMLLGLVVAGLLALLGLSLWLAERPKDEVAVRSSEQSAAPAPRSFLTVWRRGSLAAWAALALVIIDALVAATLGPQRLLALCVLVLAPGLALTPFLPRELALPAVRVAVVPIVGAAASSVAS